jgi:GNAT superfamily N-acetyltransferase
VGHHRGVKLPDGLTTRPFVPTDAQAATDLFAIAEKHDTGRVVIELEDIVGDWQRPSFDLATQAVGVFAADELVAAGEVYRARRADAAVHPDHRGRGIGTWLGDWLEDRARQDGGTVVGQTVPAGSHGERFFQQRGYTEGWTSWVLEVPADRAIEPQPLPEGCTLRDFRPGADDEVVFRLIDDAFNEWPGRQPATLDDWAARAIRRPGFEPWQLRLVEDATGTPSARHTRSSPATAATSTSWRSALTSAGWDWLAPSWPRPSNGPVSAEPPGASSRPTAARAR